MATGNVAALVIIGATGAAAAGPRTYPALVDLIARGALDVPVIGVDRSGWGQQRFRGYVTDCLRHEGVNPDGAHERRLLALLRYIDGDVKADSTYQALRAVLPAGAPVLFHLAAPATLHPAIAAAIGRAGLAAGARVLVDPPFGTDLRAARGLRATLRATFAADDIYLVGDALGEDPVGNVLVTRFANGIFEPLLNRRYVRGVQVTMAEAFGDRGDDYDATGAVRDTLANHLLVLLATVLCDPPARGMAGLGAARTRLIEAIRPLTPRHAVFGQYDGYHQVPGVAPASLVETFAAVRLDVDTWRWAGVPVLIRTGKCLPVTATEVTVRFHPAPVDVFGMGSPEVVNALRLRVAPETAVTLTVAGKRPGPRMVTEVADLSFARRPGEDVRRYDRLIGAALHGDRSPFAAWDGIEACWTVVDPVLRGGVPLCPYRPDTWGPAEADQLLPPGQSWHDPS